MVSRMMPHCTSVTPDILTELRESVSISFVHLHRCMHTNG
jgi:hypothetical protein